MKMNVSYLLLKDWILKHYNFPIIGSLALASMFHLKTCQAEWHAFKSLLNWISYNFFHTQQLSLLI